MSGAARSAAGAPRTRQAVLYLPASNARALAKARTLPVDAVILDLEDAVGPGEKDAARAAACAAVTGGGFGRREVTVRVNALGTPWHEADLAAVAAAGPDAVVVPKVATGGEVGDLVAALETAGAPDRTRLWAMVETPGAVLRCHEIATASPRLEVLVLGANDLVKELHARHVPGREPLLTALEQCVLAARAAGVAVLDGVYNDVRDLAGFEEECRQAVRLGFDGKTLIHPGQVEPCTRVFAPSPDEVADAREVVAAWEAAEGRGVVTLHGRMVEGLHVETARRVLEADAAARAARGEA